MHDQNIRNFTKFYKLMYIYIYIERERDFLRYAWTPQKIGVKFLPYALGGKREVFWNIYFGAN